MRRVLAAAVLLPMLARASTASAETPELERVPSDLPRLILDTARPALPEPEPDAYRAFIHGEYQVRYQAQRSFPLVATASAVDRQPGLAEQSIGQNHFVHHWLRLTPRLQLQDVLELVGQIDLVTGLVFGERARDTAADQTPRDAYNGFGNVQPRWLYAQYRAPFGLVRVGQQPNHWGMGIVANDGDHPSLFGDYRYGSISERILVATKPGGKDSDFYLALAGDLVFRDNTARLTRGQQALQGVLAAYWERGQNKLGLFSTLRHQENDMTSASVGYTDVLDALAIDLHGKVAAPLPGHDAFVFAEAEAAYIVGSTNFLRTAGQALDGSRTQIRSYGGAATIGVVHQSGSTATPDRPRFGDAVLQLEAGYASGDADPYDDTQRRFVFDPNHRVGLLLFDEVLRFQTARSATAATDPLLTNASRPTPGADLLASNGGVFGAQYVNPTVLVRPRPWLDLKGGAVVAQSTSDVVDPYRVTTDGSYVNHRGGDAKKKDLGVELDAGVEARIPLQNAFTAQVGAQGGVLFPGGALENADGTRLRTPWIVVGRLGLVF